MKSEKKNKTQLENSDPQFQLGKREIRQEMGERLVEIRKKGMNIEDGC